MTTGRHVDFAAEESLGVRRALAGPAAGAGRVGGGGAAKRRGEAAAAAAKTYASVSADSTTCEERLRATGAYLLSNY